MNVRWYTINLRWYTISARWYIISATWYIVNVGGCIRLVFVVYKGPLHYNGREIIVTVGKLPLYYNGAYNHFLSYFLNRIFFILLNKFFFN